MGVDSLNDYYDVNLKKARLKELEQLQGFTFKRLDLTDKEGLENLFAAHKFAYVVNLAAQAGVRHSITHPDPYVQSNIVGFLNILENCRHARVKHLVYASSSSVYGGNKKMPFSTGDPVDHPISLYAASKRANELMAHSYSALYNLPTTGLRFFTVYGPYGRPDMALFLFTKAMLAKKSIDVYNHGKAKRDFTYIDDIIDAITRIIPKAATSSERGGDYGPSTSFAPYRIYNVGNNEPVELMTFINLLEKKLGIKAMLNLMPLQSGDVPETFADVDDLVRDFGFKPSTPIEVGVGRFVDWYMDYYSK